MRLCPWALLVILGGGVLLPSLSAGDQGGRAEYVGGTVSALRGKTEGIIYTIDEGFFFFRTKKSAVRVSYDKINTLEYGQKVGRRYALAVIVSPILLLSKKRDHFLTVGYTDDEGRQQAMIFQVDKGDVRAVLVSLEAKTGRKVQYQDDEARKAGKG